MASSGQNLSEKDLAALKEAIKARFKDNSNDLKVVCFKEEPLDDALQRFLQARKFHLEKTVTCIRDAIKWRREFAAECLKLGKAACLGAEVEEVAQFYRGSYAGYCKQGRPIWYEQTGRVDIAALHCLTTDNNFLKYHVILMEDLCQDRYAESSKRLGRTINKTLTILDLEGVTMAKLSSETIEFVKCITKLDSNNYPETMGQMLIINSPGIFSFSWNIIQTFIDPRTVSKIEVLGGPEVWKPRLQQLIDADQLPAELGGSGPPCLPTCNVFETKEMVSGDKVRKELKVKENDKVVYKFFTRAGGNISFQLLFTPEGGNQAMPLVPLKEYAGDVCSTGKSVGGEVEVPSHGTVAAEWHHPNWWGRSLLYRVRVVSPTDASGTSVEAVTKKVEEVRIEN